MKRLLLILLACAGTSIALALLHASPSLANPLSITANPDPDPLCMLGDRKALVVFARFKGDTAGTSWDSSACYQWRETPNTELMPWMSKFLSGSCSDPGNCPDTTSACVAATVDTFAFEPSLTDYYDAMSNSKYWLWGTIPSTVQVTDNARSSYASGVAGIGEATREILLRLDQTVNFAEYDRNPRDGYVDQIFMVYRTFRNDSDGYTGFAWLAGPLDTDVDSTFVTNDIAYGDTIKIDLRETGRRPSGVTLEGQNIQLALQQAAHEAGHLFFSRGTGRFTHLAFLSQFGIMARGMAFSAFERERVGWITPSSTTTSQTGISLNDAFRGGSAVKLPVTSNEYFLIENRAKKTWYDQTHSEFGSSPLCYIAQGPQGVVIYHVKQGGSTELGLSDGRYHKLVDLETPEGLFEASGATIDRTKPNPFRGLDTLDLALYGPATPLATYGKPGQANTFATYTTPNTNSYVAFEPPDDDPDQLWYQWGYTGINVQNIVFNPADSTATLDVVFADSAKANHIFRPSGGAYTAKWRGMLHLVGDVSVDSLTTLDVVPGTTVKSRYDYDRSALNKKGGVDTTRVELIVGGGGTLDVNGTSDSLVTFTSTKSPPATSDWYGLRVKANGSADLNYAHVGYGVWGLSAAATPLTVAVANSRIHHHSSVGIFEEAVADTVEIQHSVIDSCGYAGIALVQKKSLSGTPRLRTRIHDNQIYGNSTYGGYEVELDNLGGTGTQVDTLWRNDLGSSAVTDAANGLYSWRDTGMSGSHATSADSVTFSYFLLDGLMLDGVTTSRLDHMKFNNIQDPGNQTGRALVLLGASSATVNHSKFEGTNYTHVWNDTLCRVALTDSNAFYNVAGPDTMVWNWDSGYTLTAQRNWWNQASCNLGPEAAKFFGPWDKANWLCSAPSLSPRAPEAIAGTEELVTEPRVSLTPNPFVPGAVIRYVVGGSGVAEHDVDITVFNIAGERMQNVLHDRRRAGVYELTWRPSSEAGALSAGVYFVRYTVDGQFRTTKVVIGQ